MTDEGWIKAEREHERKMSEAKERSDWKKREAMTTRIGYIATATAITIVVATIALLIYAWQESAGERGQELEKACIAVGGTWTTIGGGQSKVCLHLEEE
jgi:hypothetical protein